MVISTQDPGKIAIPIVAIGDESAPIQLAQCRFPGLAIPNDKILIYFFQIKYTDCDGRNFIKQHSETVMVWNYQNSDCSLRKKFIVSFIITFGTLEVVSSRSHLAGISCRRVIISEADRFSSAKVYASGWCPSVCLCRLSAIDRYLPAPESSSGQRRTLRSEGRGSTRPRRI